MGEELASRTPFLFFTDHNPDLAKAVREGRRREFASFSPRHDPEYLGEYSRSQRSMTHLSAQSPTQTVIRQRGARLLYKQLLAIRQAEIIPRLNDMQALDAHAIGPAAVLARWQMGDHALLMIGTNLAKSTAPVTQLNGRLLFANSTEAGQSAQKRYASALFHCRFLKTR